VGAVGEVLALGVLCEVSPEPELGLGATGLTGVRLVASGDGVGVGVGETDTVCSVGELPFTAEATA
jgi:hypothetical protein